MAFIVTILIACLLSLGHALDNGEALTPPMGWLAWEVFKCELDCSKNPDSCISERLFKDIADVMVKDGFVEAGYDRINIDDCWMRQTRDDDGNLMADPVRFPNGIPHLVNYMNEKGLKLGIYENIGKKTCMNFPGSRDHLKADAELFGSWNVHMVKMDGCRVPQVKDLNALYKEFGKHLMNTNKKILYSCSWPYYQIHYSKVQPNYNQISKHCNMMRTYHDITAHWGAILDTIDFTADNQDVLNRFVGPGFWNDPDMLLAGNAGLNENQAAAQFGIWALFPAPLLMSNDLRKIEEPFRKILLNREVIAINQDKLGRPGRRVFHNESLDIFVRELSPEANGSEPCYAFGVLNRRTVPKSVVVKVIPSELGIPGNNYRFRDVLKQVDLQYEKHSGPQLELHIPSTGLTLVKAVPY
ncbi:Alpha-galactosidase A [Halotydeus destructor]|nr:Alpha-galactosidase A [Halotydeus destructor]